MKKALLLSATFALLATTAVMAQKPVYTEGNKIDARLEHALKTGTTTTLAANGQYATRRISTDGRLSVIINAEDAQIVADLLEADGHEAVTVGDNIVTAKLTSQEIKQLAARSDVYTISLPRQLRPHLKAARDSIGATSVQNGVELETPYDGTGVLVGVIDQGFYPRHLAFYDANGKTRIKQWWNRISSQSTKPSIVLPQKGDGGSAAGGHATHVANIAAGRNAGNDLQGIAPNASLYFIASSFMTDELMSDMESIAKYAKENGMPYVVNMSFGSQVGPHDGTSVSDQAVDNVLQTYGGFVCASMGNEGGENIHTKHVFTAENQTRAVLISNPTSANSGSTTYVLGEIWEQAANGTKNVTFTPFYVTSSSAASKRIELSESELSQIGYYEDAIDPYNGKHYVDFQIDIDKLATLANYNGARFGVIIKGSTGDSIHAWLEAGYGTFVSGAAYLSGDDKYLVGEGAATIPHAIAVASYTTSTSWYSLYQGATYGLTGYTKGDISAFSSPGPWLGDQSILKPTVAAPGTAIESAMSQYDGEWESMKGYYASQMLTDTNKEYYYGIMSGTSMSAPMMTGAIALWLQANPELTYDDMIEIISSTARHDRWAKNTWDTSFGYGKVDVYNGLKKALEIKTASGINTASVNGDKPVTLLKESKQWRILFNDNETYADLSIYDPAGRLLTSRHLTGIHAGQEELFSFSTLTPGTYIVRLQTTAATYSRKIVVR